MSTEHLTPEQRYELGFEIVSGMHASAYNQDIERGRMETKAGTELPTPEELATEGLTEIPDYCYKSVEWEKNRLNNQIDFIVGVVLDKLVSMGLSLVSAQQVEQQSKQLRGELEKSQNSNSVLGEGWHILNEENKQLKEERGRSIWIIKQANSILNHSSYNILQKSPFAQWVKDFLNQLNQNNEG